MPLAAAGIGAGGSIIGSLIGANAASKAGKALKQTGIDVAHSYEKATQQGIDAGYAGMNQANTALDTGLATARGDITAGRDAATGAIRSGVAGGNQALTDAFGRQMGFLNPYLAAGQQGLTQLQAFMAPGGAATTPFNAKMMSANDPGYQFRMKQAADALAKTAAARGGSLGGGFATSLARQQQDLASNEYQNAWTRYMQGNQQQFNMLSGLAGIGERATGQAVNAAGNLGTGLSGNIMSGAGTEANLEMNAGTQLGQAALGVGGQKANIAQQGNQWIGQFGLQGAEAAGNAYAGGALGDASGKMAAGNVWAQGIANAGAQLGGGFLNYWAGRNGGVQNVPFDPTNPGYAGIPAAPMPAIPPPPAVSSLNPWEVWT